MRDIFRLGINTFAESLATKMSPGLYQDHGIFRRNKQKNCRKPVVKSPTTVTADQSDCAHVILNNYSFKRLFLDIPGFQFLVSIYSYMITEYIFTRLQTC